MLEVTANYLGDVQFELKARQHTVYCDQPVESGGFDEGMTPPEFFLGSVATCAGYYAVQYLKSRNLPMEGLKIRTTAGKAKAPARLADIRIEMEYPYGLDQGTREGVLNAIGKCLIHNTLTHPPEISVTVKTATPAMPIAA
jgi:putative redox protein